MVKAGALIAAGAALLLAACSSASTPTSASIADSSAPGSSAAASSAAAEPVVVGVDIGPAWGSTALKRDGAGYAMTVDSTSDPDVYDARLVFRQADGAVDEAQFLTLHVTGQSTMQIRWSDASEQDGTLRVDAGGENAVALDLGEGCVAGLPPDASADNCLFRPLSEAASPAPTASVTLALPTTDEAMSYLCSVTVAELPHVTSSKSDAYTVAVLQIALQQIGYDPGAIDGRYGPASKAAVKAYQTDAELSVDGLVGPQTWTQVRADACAVGADPAG